MEMPAICRSRFRRGGLRILGGDDRRLARHGGREGDQHVRAGRLGLTRLTLYTHVVMTENQAIYAHLGYREVERRTADGYHRVYMEKVLRPGGQVPR